MRLLLLLVLIACTAFALEHPAYEDSQTESDDICRWCLNILEPEVVKAIKSSNPTDNSRVTLENTIDAVIKSTETDDEADLIHEFIEHLRWDTPRLRQISALQRVYHKYPTYRHYFDRLVDHVVCACKPLEVHDHERALQKYLTYHSQAVQGEYMDHGWPEGTVDTRRNLRRGRRPRKNANDEL